MKIVSLRAENIKRIKAIEITADGNLVIIGGRNGQGKSSALDAIWYALGGGGALPVKPVRDGEESAVVELALDADLVVRRRFKAGGSSSLEVTTKAGAKFPSPQSVLDKLCAKLCFDPLKFIFEEPKARAVTIQRLTKLDFSGLNFDRAHLYEQRTLKGRERKGAEEALARMPHYDDAPAEVVAVASVIAKLDEAKNFNQALQAEAAWVENYNREYQLACDLARDAEAEIAELKAMLLEKQGDLKKLNDEVKPARLLKLEEAKATLATKQPVDLEPLHKAVQELDANNAKVRANIERDRAAAQAEQLKAQHELLEQQIADIDAQKAEQIKNATFPIAGLSFDDSGIAFNSIPFEQLSGAEQLRISVAVGIALNPELRVLLVRDGSLLDKDNLQLLAALAAEKDAQVWVERVGDGEEVGIVIEDGQVLEDRTVKESKENNGETITNEQ